MGRYETLYLEDSLLVFLESGLVFFDGKEKVSDFLKGDGLFIAESLLKVAKLYLEVGKYQNKKFEKVRTKALELVNQAIEVFGSIAGGSDDM